ncbi:MAG: membrane protein insertase YidC [Sandaracinaceae bacterium]|nr:membrane protein insertase YidC [Sandaracinaceae bacterium]
MSEGKQSRVFLAVAVAAAAAFAVMMFMRKGEDARPARAPAPTAQQATQNSHGPQAPVSTAEQRRVLRAQRAAAERTLRIETPEYIATVTNLNASVRHFEMKNRRYDEHGRHRDLVTTQLEEYLPLRTELGGVNVPEDAIWQMQALSPQAVLFTYEGGGFRVERKLEAGRGPYQLWSTIRITNLGEHARPVRVNLSTHHYVRNAEESTSFINVGNRSPALSRGLCRHGDSIAREPHDKSSGFAHRYHDVTFAGVDNTYFANVMATEGTVAESCRIVTDPRMAHVGDEDPDGFLFSSSLIYPRVTLAPRESTTVRSLAYMGPKTPDTLSAAGHHLNDVVDLGWFAMIANVLVKLLSIIHGFVGNWGLAIIVLTLLVKLILFPLTLPQVKSMAKMRALKPEMDRINALYGDDREKKAAATMELHRKNGVNPVAGCLPQLLQLPIWWALYASLSSNIELFRAPFGGWLQDLSAPDPYFIMPLLLGALMVVQQRITPQTTMDPVQAKMMMYMMPVMITVLMLFLPQGLTLYMFTNSALGIAQQRFIEYRLKNHPELMAQQGATSNAPPAIQSGGSSAKK